MGKTENIWIAMILCQSFPVRLQSLREELKKKRDVVDRAAKFLWRQELAITSLSKDFLDGLGRLLLSRSPQFRKAYKIGELVTVDERGYLSIDPSFAEEVFASQFFDILEECLRRGELPPKNGLFEEFKSAEILRADGPLERSCCGGLPRILARRKRKQFLKILADCVSASFHTAQKFDGIRVPRGLRGQDSKSPKRIRIRSPEQSKIQQEWTDMLEDVLLGLLERTAL